MQYGQVAFGSNRPRNFLSFCFTVLFVTVTALVCAALLSGCSTVQPSIEPDGQIAGIVPVEVAAPLADKVDKRAGQWLRDYGDGMRFLAAVPQGQPVHYGIRRRGTAADWLDLSAFEQVWWMEPVVSAIAVPAPQLGSRVDVRPILSPVPPSITPPAGRLPEPALPPQEPAKAPAGGTPNSTLTEE